MMVRQADAMWVVWLWSFRWQDFVGNYLSLPSCDETSRQFTADPSILLPSGLRLAPSLLGLHQDLTSDPYYPVAWQNHPKQPHFLFIRLPKDVFCAHDTRSCISKSMQQARERGRRGSNPGRSGSGLE